MVSMQVHLTWCGCKYVPYPPSATQFKSLPAKAMEDLEKSYM